MREREAEKGTKQTNKKDKAPAMMRKKSYDQQIREGFGEFVYTHYYREMVCPDIFCSYDMTRATRYRGPELD